MMLRCFLKLNLADVIAPSFRLINVVHALFLLCLLVQSSSLNGFPVHLQTISLIKIFEITVPGWKSL